MGHSLKILIVAATPFEIKALTDRFRPETVTPGLLYRFKAGPNVVHLLIPGIGILPTAFELGKIFVSEIFDLAVNAGICGAYQRDLEPGTVVRVTEETLPELGIGDGRNFLSVFQAGLIPPDNFPFTKGKLINPYIPPWESVRKLMPVCGNTILTMRTSSSGIRELLTQAPAGVETMEGAAFLYCCLAAQVPCVQIRSVSNLAGERNKEKWDIGLAVKNLVLVLEELLDEIICNS